MYRFHCTVHVHPAASAGTTARLDGGEFASLQIDPAALAVPFPCSFEQAAQSLGVLPRMFCEADGAFVWVCAAQETPSWQVDGVLYDRGGRLLYVDLKGNCPPEQFDSLLAALGWPDVELAFQLTKEAVFLAEQEFRRYARADRIDGFPEAARPPD